MLLPIMEFGLPFTRCGRRGGGSPPQVELTGEKDSPGKAKVQRVPPRVGHILSRAVSKPPASLPRVPRQTAKSLQMRVMCQTRWVTVCLNHIAMAEQFIIEGTSPFFGNCIWVCLQQACRYDLEVKAASDAFWLDSFACETARPRQGHCCLQL